MQRPFFYHLSLELYSKSSPHSKTKAGETVYTPPSDTDIFSSLPVHSTLGWSESSSDKPRHKRSETVSRSCASTEAIEHEDWRFGKISIQSIDMEERSVRLEDQNKEEKRALGSKPVSNSIVKGRFEPSSPKNTQVGWGVVHLYRDVEETSGLYDETKISSDSTQDRLFDENTCSTLCILAVPSYMSSSDLLGFVGEQTREDVSHFRLLRTERANRYMVLMKFREAAKAKQWLKEWNGKPFNSMDPENCHVVFVKSIAFPPTSSDGEEEAAKPSSYPSMTDDPFTPAAQPEPTAPTLALTKPLAPPTSSLVELPTCPVCLERMDSSTGLLTILCQHVFHCDCLQAWRGSGCPVCRYTQADSMHDSSRYETRQCSVCSSNQNLWICLICGNVGCGRYDSAHAYAHYEERGHAYAMDVGTQHVWDYAGDGYVHRLISTRADVKANDRDGGGGTGMTMALYNDSVSREKLEDVNMEYAYMLTSQLDSQRLYFEEQMERAVDKASTASAAAEKASRAAEELAERLDVIQDSYAGAQRRISELEKDVDRAQKRAEKAEQLSRKFMKDWQEEKTMGQGMSKKMSALEQQTKDAESKLGSLKLEKADLEEQNRDLMLFVSGQAKVKELEEQGEDMEGATAEVGAKKRGKGRK